MKKFLKALKWFLFPITLVAFLLFIDAATDAFGITDSEEGLMYAAWALLIVNAGLFIFNRKWCDLVDRML